MNQDVLEHLKKKVEICVMNHQQAIWQSLANKNEKKQSNEETTIYENLVFLVK